ncbi:NADPH-dependent F420 reductase [Peterkaempfera bronchialis]|uniref:NADP oxidoreductase n=1 Tax=Peterkaempfera bronchialis TaxID=2126346 RepID=A0A345T6P4_9ACTN|nr:NAD(P)-binding domain-containing protein [Peterkaempfera bronchialis]AXI81649.1 NADP oxidoreductase [Peterkaempfera bronchialis]
MRIAILGTGAVCRVLLPAFARLGHEVVVGTRDPAATAAANPDLIRAAARHTGAAPVPFAQAAAGADLVVNAISGPFAVQALTPLAEVLRGVVLMDVSSPFDFTAEDAVLDPANTDSLGERLQRALPDTPVVKTLNTLAAVVMTAPGLVGGGDHSVFVSGDDPRAKAVVTGLLEALGWRDVIDLGGIRTARSTEMMLQAWLDLSRALSTDFFGFKIVRSG